jgi:rhodanese-related sulfurtransferase
MALGAFIAAEWMEGKFGGKDPDADSLLTPARRLAPARKFALVLVGGGVIAALAGNPYRGPFARVDTKQLALDLADGADRVSVEELAQHLIEGRIDFVIVDVRGTAAFARYHIPGAIRLSLTEINGTLNDRRERILCYSDGDREAAQAVVLLRAAGFAASYALAGGMNAWQSHILYPAAPQPHAPAAQQRDFAQRVAVARFFGGGPQVEVEGANGSPALPTMLPPPPTNTGGVKPVAAKKKKEGC